MTMSVKSGQIRAKSVENEAMQGCGRNSLLRFSEQFQRVNGVLTMPLWGEVLNVCWAKKRRHWGAFGMLKTRVLIVSG